MKKTIAIARTLPIDYHSVLGSDVELRVFEGDVPPSRDELASLVRDCDGLVTTLSDRVDAELLSLAPRLRVVANYAVGFDNIDVAACHARGVVVCNTPDVLTEATADLAMTLLLALTRRVREGERMMREGRFDGWAPTMLLGAGLRGKTLGIIGRGRIGAAFQARAEAFGMKAMHHSRRGGVPLETLLRESDVVSLHAPLTDGTRHILNRETMAWMKPSAVIINTARGPLVDEAALVAALESGQIAGAGLDVFEEEPRVHPGLIERDDVVLLPHLGSATRETRHDMAELALSNVREVLAGRPAKTPVG